MILWLVMKVKLKLKLKLIELENYLENEPLEPENEPENEPEINTTNNVTTGTTSTTDNTELENTPHEIDKRRRKKKGNESSRSSNSESVETTKKMKHVKMPKRSGRVTSDMVYNRGKESKEESDSYLNRNIWYTVQYDDDNTSTIHDRDSVWTYIENAPIVEVTAASVPLTFIPLPCSSKRYPTNSTLATNANFDPWLCTT